MIYTPHTLTKKQIPAYHRLVLREKGAVVIRTTTEQIAFSEWHGEADVELMVHRGFNYYGLDLFNPKHLKKAPDEWFPIAVLHGPTLLPNMIGNIADLLAQPDGTYVIDARGAIYMVGDAGDLGNQIYGMAAEEPFTPEDYGHLLPGMFPVQVIRHSRRKGAYAHIDGYEHTARK